MPEEAGPQRRRRTPPGTQTPPRPASPPSAAAGATRRRRSPRDAGSERGMRDLAGVGPTQVSVSAALRARDVNRPSEDDLAAAERDVVIVRRNWRPEAG